MRFGAVSCNPIAVHPTDSAATSYAVFVEDGRLCKITTKSVEFIRRRQRLLDAIRDRPSIVPKIWFSGSFLAALNAAEASLKGSNCLLYGDPGVQKTVWGFSIDGAETAGIAFREGVVIPIERTGAIFFSSNATDLDWKIFDHLDTAIIDRVIFLGPRGAVVEANGVTSILVEDTFSKSIISLSKCSAEEIKARIDTVSDALGAAGISLPTSEEEAIADALNPSERSRFDTLTLISCGS